MSVIIRDHRNQEYRVTVPVETGPEGSERLTFDNPGQAHQFVQWGQFLARTNPNFDANLRAVRAILGRTACPQVGTTEDPQLLSGFSTAIGARHLTVWRVPSERTVPTAGVPSEAPTPAARAPSAPRSPEEVPVRLRFQICPGEFEGVGIEGASYEILHESTGVTDVGRTDRDGEIRFRMRHDERPELRIFGTSYSISLEDPLDRVRLQAEVEAARHRTDFGVRKALDVLGYLTGYLRDPVPEGNDPLTLAGNASGARAEHALQEFQADHGQTSDAVLRPETKSRLRDAVGR